MTKENAKDFLPLVQALADGKMIQYQMCHEDDDGNKWKDTLHPAFDMLPCCYRVKPEPRRIWVSEKNGMLGAYVTDPENPKLDNVRQVEFVEVIK